MVTELPVGSRRKVTAALSPISEYSRTHRRRPGERRCYEGTVMDITRRASWPNRSPDRPSRILLARPATSASSAGEVGRICAIRKLANIWSGCGPTRNCWPRTLAARAPTSTRSTIPSWQICSAPARCTILAKSPFPTPSCSSPADSTPEEFKIMQRNAAIGAETAGNWLPSLGRRHLLAHGGRRRRTMMRVIRRSRAIPRTRRA